MSICSVFSFLLLLLCITLPHHILIFKKPDRTHQIDFMTYSRTSPRVLVPLRVGIQCHLPLELLAHKKQLKVPPKVLSH